MDRKVSKLTIWYVDGGMETLDIDGFHRTSMSSDGSQSPPAKIVYDVHEIRWRDPDRPYVPEETK